MATYTFHLSNIPHALGPDAEAALGQTGLNCRLFMTGLVTHTALVVVESDLPEEEVLSILIGALARLDITVRALGPRLRPRPKRQRFTLAAARSVDMTALLAAFDVVMPEGFELIELGETSLGGNEYLLTTITHRPHVLALLENAAQSVGAAVDEFVSVQAQLAAIAEVDRRHEESKERLRKANEAKAKKFKF